jgi:hypothetical protein
MRQVSAQIHWQENGNNLIVPSKQSLLSKSDLGGYVLEIKTNVRSTFPTCLISIANIRATLASGSVLFYDWLFSSRMYFTDKLVGSILCNPNIPHASSTSQVALVGDLHVNPLKRLDRRTQVQAVTVGVNSNFIPGCYTQIFCQFGRQDNISLFINLGVVYF